MTTKPFFSPFLSLFSLWNPRFRILSRREISLLPCSMIRRVKSKPCRKNPDKTKRSNLQHQFLLIYLSFYLSMYMFISKCLHQYHTLIDRNLKPCKGIQFLEAFDPNLKKYMNSSMNSIASDYMIENVSQNLKMLDSDNFAKICKNDKSCLPFLLLSFLYVVFCYIFIFRPQMSNFRMRLMNGIVWCPHWKCWRSR